MYNLYGFGKRIASFRKLSGLTQEELASRLNITAQAVSKWENEISFPEITMLPQLAKELNTTIEQLFGVEEEALKGMVGSQNNIPIFSEDMGENLKLVYYFGNVACYSEKQVDVTRGDTVIFKDGSSANLSALEIVNKGPGEVRFDCRDDIPVYGNIDPTKTSIDETFDNINSLEILIDSADVVVSRSTDGNTYVKAMGTPMFIDRLTIAQVRGTLQIKHERRNNVDGNSERGNKVCIAFGSDAGKRIRAAINGSGSIDVQLPFRSGSASINGSGDITLTDIDDLDAGINGSGDIQCNRVLNQKIKINGSGDYSANESMGAFKGTINGSGDINLKNGELDTFDLAIRGSGDVNAKNVSTRTAKIVIIGAGDVILGRVIEKSIEKHSRRSTVQVLKRG